jgi:hypothetical protein
METSHTIEICSICREVIHLDIEPKQVAKDRAKAERRAGELLNYICPECVAYFRGLAV